MSISALSGCTNYERIPQSAYTLESPILSDTGFSFIKAKDYTIYQGNDINSTSIDWEQPVTKPSTRNTFDRSIYALVSKNNKDTLYISNRLIPFKKTLNFRDLGGIKTQEGRQIKWGKLYRSGKFDKVKKSEIEVMEKMKIAKVIDLRTHGEVADHPDKILSYSSIKWIHNPISGITYEDLEKTKKEIKQQSPQEFDGNGKMEESMLRFARDGKKDFGNIFKEILNTHPDSAIVYHCTAGKDRTGLMTALLLHSLDVDQRTIEDDYLLSNYFRYEKMEKNARLGAHIFGIENESLRPIMEVRTSYLQTSYDYINQEYGSIDQYLESMGIGEHEKNELKKRFLY